MAIKTWTGGAADFNWATSGNWSPSGAPANGDTVFFDANGATRVDGSDQSAVTLAKLYVYNTFGSSSPGTILFGSNGTALKIGVSGIVQIGGQGDSITPGQGSQRVNLDLAATGPAMTVLDTNSTSLDPSKETVRVKGSGSPKLTVFSGYVGVATDNTSDTATMGQIVAMGGQVNCGAGCTLSTVIADGGIIVLNSAPSTLTSVNGDTTTYGTFDVATIIIYGGAVHLNHRPASGNGVDSLTQYGGQWDTGAGGVGMQIGSLVKYP